MRLRDSALNDDEAVAELFAGIIRSLMLEGKYLILLTFDKYDVPSYSKDDIKIEDSSEVFSYLICAVCPVKMTKPALSYYVNENQFRNISVDWIINTPELGFMFPALTIGNQIFITRYTIPKAPLKITKSLSKLYSKLKYQCLRRLKRNIQFYS